MISSFIREYFNSSLEVAGSWLPLHIPQMIEIPCDPLGISPPKKVEAPTLDRKKKKRQGIFLMGI